MTKLRRYGSSTAQLITPEAKAKKELTRKMKYPDTKGFSENWISVMNKKYGGWGIN